MSWNRAFCSFSKMWHIIWGICIIGCHGTVVPNEFLLIFCHHCLLVLELSFLILKLSYFQLADENFLSVQIIYTFRIFQATHSSSFIRSSSCGLCDEIFHLMGHRQSTLLKSLLGTHSCEVDIIFIKYSCFAIIARLNWDVVATLEVLSINLVFHVIHIESDRVIIGDGSHGCLKSSRSKIS